MNVKYPIVILSGPPASGKTALAQLLCDQFTHAVHIETDEFRRLVVKGFASPFPKTQESERQFLLMAQNASLIAKTYQIHYFFSL